MQTVKATESIARWSVIATDGGHDSEYSQYRQYRNGDYFLNIVGITKDGAVSCGEELTFYESIMCDEIECSEDVCNDFVKSYEAITGERLCRCSNCLHVGIRLCADHDGRLDVHNPNIERIVVAYLVYNRNLLVIAPPHYSDTTVRT